MSPKVGSKHYSYGPKGQAAARKEAARTGKPVVQAPKKGGKGGKGK